MVRFMGCDALGTAHAALFQSHLLGPVCRRKSRRTTDSGSAIGVERARQTLNRAKLILGEIMDGNLVANVAR